jgi:release factor glutamine methyltransferase
MQKSMIQSLITQKLSAHFSADEISAFGFWLLPHCETLSEEQIPAELDIVCAELIKKTPIQYIFETAFFGPLTLKVSPATLIPRPETEELCHLILQDYKKQQTPNDVSIRGLDIGTGSGCIPMYLLHHQPSWTFTAVDVSEDALDIAAENAFHIGVQERIELRHSDFLQWESIPEHIDLLISNPPYVRLEEAEQMDENVLNHEPHLALFTPENDPLIFYRKLATLAEKDCHSRSTPLHIWLEINQYLSEETRALFCHFAEAEVIRDLSNNPRFIHAVARPLK